MKKVRISISMVDRNTMCKESEMNTSAKNETAFTGGAKNSVYLKPLLNKPIMLTGLKLTE